MSTAGNTRGLIPKDKFSFSKDIFCYISFLLCLRYDLLTEAESGLGPGFKGTGWERCMLVLCRSDLPASSSLWHLECCPPGSHSVGDHS